MPDTRLGDLPAFVATPPVGEGPWPGVVVIHEVFGLNDDIREHALRIAAAGYVAVAPDLYRGRSAWRCVLGAFRALQAGRGRAVRRHRGGAVAAWPRVRTAPAASGSSASAWAAGSRCLSAARGFDVVRAELRAAAEGHWTC